MADHPGKDATLHTRILNEYKEGKAFRLYTSRWLKEVFINAISPESRYCFLKAKCTHTMKISDVPCQWRFMLTRKYKRIAKQYLFTTFKKRVQLTSKNQIALSRNFFFKFL